jgi:alcohol-forming fatty acyl-CoA reductase
MIHTGFMGKVLIDKLLRTCPGIENIYLLIRKKKGKDIHARIEELFDDPVMISKSQIHKETKRRRRKKYI